MRDLWLPAVPKWLPSLFDALDLPGKGDLRTSSKLLIPTVPVLPNTSVRLRGRSCSVARLAVAQVLAQMGKASNSPDPRYH